MQECSAKQMCPEMEWCPLFKRTLETEEVRSKNAYDVTEDVERRRLAFQMEMTREIDVRVLKSILSNTKGVQYILDIGCNDGSWLLDRLTNIGKECYAVGVDINEEIISRANENFPEMLTVCSDCEKEDFVEQIYKKIPYGTQFDVVVLSMVLLHVKEPMQVLRNVRKLLKTDGVVYIRDMDDGLSVAYPDKDGVFARVRRICNDVKYTGYRTNGREIYGLLQRTGYKDIKNIGINVDVTMSTPDDYKFREDIFTINFGFIPGDLALALQDDPLKYKEDYLWLKNTGYEALNGMFHTAEFYYRMGLMGFTARKI